MAQSPNTVPTSDDRLGWSLGGAPEGFNWVASRASGRSR